MAQSLPSTAQSLYRKWRSHTFADVVGQDHVTQTLRNAVRFHQVGHAYLFAGPRGTGKTSTARILARALNCLRSGDGEPCNECPPCQSMLANRCLDVVEIDAASNNSVDDVRDLRDKVNFAPTEVQRKVYIVDEAHMLSSSAFNALLKTLEEPPPHVLFVLATTDVHKVPATITSRCQRLDFRAIIPRDIVARLAYVCEQEQIRADEPALELIAQQATGSLRDALSLLEQVHAYEGATLGVADVEEALGLARRETLAGLTESIVAGDTGAALTLIGELAAAGADMRQYARQLVHYWRDLLLLCAGGASALGRTPDGTMLTQAARLTSGDVTAILRAILQPDYSGRRSAAAQWQLELAVAEASAHFARAGATTSRVDAVEPAAVKPATMNMSGGAARPRVERVDADAGRPAAPAVRASQRPHDPRPGPPAGTPSSPSAREETQPALARAPVGAGDGDTGRAVEEDHGAITAPALSDDGELTLSREAERRDGSRGKAPHKTVDNGAEPAISAAPPASSSDRDPREVWQQALADLAAEGKASLLAHVKDTCVPIAWDGDTFVVAFPPAHSWQQKQVEMPHRRAVFEATLARVVGRAVSLRCDTMSTNQASPVGPGQAAPTDTFIEDAQRRLFSVYTEHK